jgi:hypothetical protein
LCEIGFYGLFYEFLHSTPSGYHFRGVSFFKKKSKVRFFFCHSRCHHHKAWQFAFFINLKKKSGKEEEEKPDEISRKDLIDSFLLRPQT